MKFRFLKYGIGMAVLSLLTALYYIGVDINSLKLEPGKGKTIWVQSQNGNDDEALIDVKKSDKNGKKLQYAVEKYAEIGVITLPDVDTFFSKWHDGRKVKDINTAPFANGLTIIDNNKVSYMDGAIRYWKVVSKDDNNEVRLAVFRYDKAVNRYQLINCSPVRVASKGLNIFFEETSLQIKQNDVLGLQIKKPVSSNRVLLNEMAEVITTSGFQNRVGDPKSVKDRGNSSFSFSALLESGNELGSVSFPNNKDVTIKLPSNPVYGHLSWYKFDFTSDGGTFYLKPRLGSLLLNANSYIGLLQTNGSPWTPNIFSVKMVISLLLLFGCAIWLVSLNANQLLQTVIALAMLLIIFALSKYYAVEIPEFQFVSIFAAFIFVFLIPGIIISRHYSTYGLEIYSGRAVLAFTISIVYWFLPAAALFLIKTSYWPFIAAAVILLLLFFPPKNIISQKTVVGDKLSAVWEILQTALWVVVGLLVIHTLFSTRFHAEIFDSFHHISLAVKNFSLPVNGDMHTNLYDVTMRTMAPYAYNYWGLLMGMVTKISGFDIGTIFCVGNALLVLFMFITQWWIIGLLVNSQKIKILAFGIIIAIYITRTLATFAVIFQRSEFAFITYGPSVNEFFLYAVYIILGIRAIHSGRLADMLLFCGLSLTMAFFHLQFVFLNAVVIALLILLSLWESSKFRPGRMHGYLLLTAVLLGLAGFVVQSHLALGKIADTSSPHYSWMYALRYEDYSVLQRFYYIFKDLFKLITLYIWHAVAIWGGLLLVIFPEKKMSSRLFNTAYFIIILMLLFSYNPISEMVLTPLMTSLPVKRIEIYLRPITFTLAAVVLSVIISNIIGFLNNHFKSACKYIYVVVFLLLCLPLLTYKQWSPQLYSLLSTITYNHGNYVDITYVANLPEVKFLNKYSHDKHINILIEYPYNYAIPSLSRTYSYYHTHYPKIDFGSLYLEREHMWQGCLNAESRCDSLLPKSSLLLVRNDNVMSFIKLGYSELYKGRLFTVFKV